MAIERFIAMTSERLCITDSSATSVVQCGSWTEVSKVEVTLRGCNDCDEGFVVVDVPLMGGVHVDIYGG